MIVENTVMSFRNAHWKKELKGFLNKLQNDDLMLKASSMAFTSVLSMVPVLAFGYFLFSAFGDSDRLQDDMEKFIGENLAPSFAGQILDYFQVIRKKISAGTLGTFGVVGFIYTSVSMLTKIEMTFNSIWGVTTSRPWLRRLTNYWTLISLTPLFFGLSFLAIRRVQGLVVGGGGVSVSPLWAVVPVVMDILLFTLLFTIIPNTRIHRRTAIKAGLVTGLYLKLQTGLYSLCWLRF